MTVQLKDIVLKRVSLLIWDGKEISIWYAAYCDGRTFCPPVIFFDEMPETLQKLFSNWLKVRKLSVTMPPRLPRPGRAYFLDDVQSAIDGAELGSD